MNAQRLLFSAASEICARCDGQMTVTRDAIGRPRLRCPKCDGVSRIRPHPDEVLLPQGLVRAAPALPPIGDGQLRCQLCARGVDGDSRLCARCQAARDERAAAERAAQAFRNRSAGRLRAVYREKRCRRCGRIFRPTGPRSLDCEACR